MIKNTTGQHISFVALATADGAAVTTGTPTVYLSKDAAAQATSSNTASHVGNGVWILDLTQSETNADHLSAIMVLTNAVNSFAQTFPYVLSDFKADVSNLDAAVSSRSTFDHSSNQVTTDSASRTASQADVSALATVASIAALNNFNPASDAVITDSASRTAAQADVSALATASELASIDALVDAIKAVTDNLPNSGALTDIATAAAVTTIDSVTDSILVIANKLDSAMEADGLVSRFTTNALEQAPSSSGGDATASNQSAIITHLTDIKGSGFASTDALEAIRDRGDSAWTTGGSGSGIYSLTVTCQDSSGSAVANVRVNIDGTTTTLVTNSSGQCVFNLDAGDYSLVASPPSEFNTPADTAVAVSADGSQTITLTQASTSGSAGWVG